MTNFRVIAAVTAAMKQVLQNAGGNCDIRVGAPTAKMAEDTDPRINLFLFRTTPNVGAVNAHQPFRGSDGTMRRRAEAALDLHYVLSFYGDPSKYEPERLLGAATIALEEVPALFASAIAEAVTNVDPDDPTIPEALAKVRITRQQMSLEDFSKLWSVFFQVPYALSAVYVCSHVLLESQQRIGSPVPVTRGDFLAGPIFGFSLLWAGPDGSGAGPVLWDGPLHLAGRGLGRSGTSLRIDDQIVALDPDTLSDGAIRVDLQAPDFAELPAGIHVAQAIAPPPKSTTPDKLRRRSNTISFAIHPKIALGAVTPGPGPAESGTIAVDFLPEVAPGQAVTVTLDSRDPNAPFNIVLDPDPPDASGATLTFPFEGVPAGTYLARAHVEGFASLPEMETDTSSPDYGQIIGPEVAL